MRYAFILLLLMSLSLPVYAEDMRAVSLRAKAEYDRALSEARKSQKRIFNDRVSLKKEIAETERQVRALRSDIARMEAEAAALRKKEAKLSHQRIADEADMENLAGTVRVIARDLETTLMQSPFTARFHDRPGFLKPIFNKKHFPGLDDLKTVTDLFFQEMKLSGEVVLQKGRFIDTSGLEKEGDILTIGKFSAAYRTNNKTGFLSYSEKSGRFFALTALPSWFVRRNLKEYMAGKTDDVFLDISGGAAMRQIIHRLSLADQIRSGGVLVWPILAIGLFALFIVAERISFLKGVRINTDRIMGTVNDLASMGEWEGCENILKAKKGRPVCNVLQAGLKAREENRETLESILQEAILRELPRLERFLPTLNIMGAVAPLLGLLGTVTGMISTFHVITLYGTGDPRLMSGGISVALVTTMLGLAVAIPIMLMHTFLSRRVDTIVGDMEEKSIALTNIISKVQT